ncbi:MAG: homocysteine S-methyltransferase family protein, partial [Clostridia bacterium]|nr:homocysteine S-methyltransferase family protein [Clostridia bacterium]
SLHKDYIDAGANIIKTNTFGANPLKFNDESEYNYAEIIEKAVENVKTAIKLSERKDYVFTAFDMGPLGRLLKPFGDLGFEEAVELFAKQVRAAVKCGVDLILIETMNDSYETKAAVLACKENSDLPVFVTNAYDKTGKLMTGADPKSMIAMLEGLRVDAVGVNCSLGPDLLTDIIKTYSEYSSLPVIANPNAGLPSVIDGKTVYSFSSDEFCDAMGVLVENGAVIIGGCCGTTPEYIKKLAERTKGMKPRPVTEKNYTIVSSYTHAVEIGDKPVLIGERINPTGKKRFKEALINKDFDYILKEGINQQEKGADILDVNVGLPGTDEVQTICKAVVKLQEVSDLPLQIDTADSSAMEAAMRLYNGKPMVNSVNGKEESMEKIFPLVKKYGGVVVALTLDESGIPDTAEGRIKIAERIYKKAAEYGISKKDIIVDPLAMTISSDTKAALATLEALKIIRNEHKVNTSLGISNISFGLPEREFITSTFFSMALANGLSAAIMNPYSAEMMKVYYSYMALTNRDANCEKYIEFASSVQSKQIISVGEKNESAEVNVNTLSGSVIKGLKEQAARITKDLIKSTDPMELINSEIIPALDTVGKGFEQKTVYLPQLLMSAESAKASFEVIKEHMSANNTDTKKKCTFVIATVKGDIHDIGKNIVKVLLENYDFNVIDLGKDVPAEEILETVTETKAPLCGLSALMTTTVPSMEETIKLIKEKAPWCKIVVGGAVLTEDYANMINADKYAADAMETVRYAERINSEL